MSELEPIEVKIKEEAPKAEPEIDIGAEKPAEPEAKAAESAASAESEAVELLKREVEAKRREAEVARRMKEEAERVAAMRQQEIRHVQVQAADNQVTAFVNAIASFEREGEMLEKELTNALENNDYTKAAKLQRQLGQIDNRLSMLSQGKEQLEAQLNQERVALEQQMRAPPPPQQPLDPVEAQIVGLPDRAKNWIRQRPEVITNPSLNAKMRAAHYSAVAEGIPEGSDDYYSYVEQTMGYGENKTGTQPQTQQRQRSISMAAPVTRSSSPASPTSSGEVTIHLTPEMREIARMNDMTDEQYALFRQKEIQKGNIRAQ